MVYGSAAPAPATIDVPVFLAFGEQDLSPKPEAEIGQYGSTDDVTLFVVPKFAGTFTANTPQCRRASNRVGCPWFESPGAIKFSAPTGISMASAALRL